MTKMHETPITLAELERVLDVYGAEAARWPAESREALQALADSDETARRLLAEARALDAVLAQAPSGDASERLKSRIVAAALEDGKRDARVVPLAAMARARNSAVRSYWPAAALLAASFALGLYLGVAGLADTTLQGTLRYAAADAASEDGESLFGSAGSWLSDQEEQL